MDKIIEIMRRRQRRNYIIMVISAGPLLVAGYLFAVGEWLLAVLPFAFWLVLNIYVFYDYGRPTKY